MKNFKKPNGITLIALIITIIIMLILATVTIGAINGGLFDYAGKAKKDAEITSEKELLEQAAIIAKDINKYGIIKANSIQSTLDKSGVKAIAEEACDIVTVIFEDANRYYKIDQEGNVSFLPITAEGQEEGTVILNPSTYGNNVLAIADGQNKYFPLPKGFYYVGGTVDTGVVISDLKGDDLDNSKQGNQFVWIPVTYIKSNVDDNDNDIDDAFENVFFRSLWNNNSRSTNLTTNNTYKEPYTDAADWENNEYYAMMQSVQKYMGFYIGRYEAGETEDNKFVVKRDQKPYTNIKWGNSMTEIGTTSAVYLCQKLYEGNNYGAQSTLCYGVQWDAMLSFIKDNTHNVTSSSSWGNYKNNLWTIDRQTAQYYGNSKWNKISDEAEKKKTKTSNDTIPLTTGASNIFQSKNIYDVAGNVYEWTMEAYNSDKRIFRGGAYRDDFMARAPASGRDNDFNGSGYIGFRPALYIK